MKARHKGDEGLIGILNYFDYNLILLLIVGTKKDKDLFILDYCVVLMFLNALQNAEKIMLGSDFAILEGSLISLLYELL